MNDTFSKRFCESVRNYCRMTDIQIGAVENNAECSPGYISRIIHENTTMNFEIVCRISEYLGKPVQYFLDNEDLIRIKELRKELEMLEKKVRANDY